MNIAKDQIWTRKRHTAHPIPERGWKVVVISANSDTISYEVKEYNGNKVFGKPRIIKSVDEFLDMYEQD
jgi:hypothetical protein